MSGVPRAELGEVITRWELAKIPLIVVEGPYDQRLMHVASKESWYPEQLKGVDVWCADAIQVPSAITTKHGLHGTGAKQRVIGFIREMESRAIQEGFRGIVDRDLDSSLGLDHSSIALIYTDFSCAECYFWNHSVLEKLLTYFKCEHYFSDAALIGDLYQSISEVASYLTAVRAASELLPGLISFSESDKSWQLKGGIVSIDRARFLAQCKIRGGDMDNVSRTISTCLAGQNQGLLHAINGHDLIRLLAFAMKNATNGSARLVDAEVIENVYFAVGISNTNLSGSALLGALEGWKAAM
jgi:hypothetical protein